MARYIHNGNLIMGDDCEFVDNLHLLLFILSFLRKNFEQETHSKYADSDFENLPCLGDVSIFLLFANKKKQYSHLGHIMLLKQYIMLL